MHITTRVVLVEVLALVTIGVAHALGLRILEGLPRAWLLLAHIVGAVLFLGNVVVGALLLAMSDARGDVAALPFVSTFIGWADALFTGPGVVLLFASGLALAVPMGGWQHAAWTFWAMVSLLASGALWVLVLVPLQQRMITRAESRDLLGWRRLARVYTAPGVASLLLLVAALVLMVLKPS